MRFSAYAWPGLVDGTITRTFRTWSRAQVRPGGDYRVSGMLLHVDAVARVPVESLTKADARAAGEADLAALLSRLRATEATVWRVDLHYVGPDDRIALRTDTSLDDVELAALRSRLDRIDARAGRPWTRETLQLIKANPGVVSTVLAERIGLPRPEFKVNVRKLKNLGLTESLDVGYRLSPRGELVVDG